MRGNYLKEGLSVLCATIILLLFLGVVNLMLTLVLMIGGIILLFIKTMPHSYNRSYRNAKCYMAYMWWLLGTFIIIALTIGKFSGEKIEILNIYNVASIPIGAFLGIYSFLYLCNAQKSTRLKFVWIFSLPLFLVLLHYIMEVFCGNQAVYSIAEYAHTITVSPTLIVRTAILVTTIASILISVVQCFKVRKEYEKVLKNLSADNEKKHCQWIGKMFYSIIPIMIFVTFSHFINSNYYHVGSDAILIAVVIFYTIRIINYQCQFHGTLSTTEILETKQEEPIENKMEVTAVKSRQVNSSVQKTIRSEKKHRMIHESIEKWIIDEEKAYLKNGLTIQDVSLMTGVPKRRLADFIHSHYNLSFNSWINTLRVQEVERILSNKESYTMTLSEIAYKTGFSDLSNMSSTFKKIKGMNPSEYRILIRQ